MAKSLLRISARKLRGQGESIKVIARQLGVSQGSVSMWCRDIKLTSMQIAQLQIRAHDPHYGKRLGYALKQQKQRADKIYKLRNRGIRNVGKLKSRSIFIAGAALYWAEGFKKDSQVGFANTDPTMIQFFIRWIVNCCGVPIERLSARVTINDVHRHRISEIQQYWQNITSIPIDNFKKPYLFTTVVKKIYEDDTKYYGVLRIKVRKSTDLLRLIHGWIDGLKENSK